MSQGQEPPLQPLRIPTGWVVEWNTFLEIDPSSEDDEFQLMYFSEDLLQISGKVRPILLDLGWYPAGNALGQYRVVAIRRHTDQDEMVASWDRPLRTLATRSRLEVVQAIEAWLREFISHAS